jgi:hypothetical protein
VDSAEAPYITGFTQSAGLATFGAFQTQMDGAGDAYVAKFGSQGNTLAYATYLGGSAWESGYGIAVDASGAAYVTGSTQSTNFPTSGAFQATDAGGEDAFAVKLGASGNTMAYGTYLGGSSYDRGLSVAVDSNGNATVAGWTLSPEFPVAGAVQGSSGGGYDAFVTTLRSTGSSLLFSSYLGGSGGDFAFGICIPALGLLTVAGETNSSDFPTEDPYQSSKAGSYDAFVSRFEYFDPPSAPASLQAMAPSSGEVDLTWADESDNEGWFELEWKWAALPYSRLARPAAGATSFQCLFASGDTEYTFRIRAVNGVGPSDWSNEATVTTPPGPPGPPVPPADLVATVVSTSQVDLAWSDLSQGEQYYNVLRRGRTSSAEVIAVLPPDSATYSDMEVLPDRTYVYTVQAGNVSGPSAVSNEATVGIGPTLAVEIAKGRASDRAPVRGDSLRLRGTWEASGEVSEETPDLVTVGFELRMGDQEGQRVLLLAPEDPGWKERNGRFIWKGPKGALTRARVVLVPEAGTLRIDLARLTVDAPLANPIRISLSAGSDAGHHEEGWRTRRGGRFRYP